MAGKNKENNKDNNKENKNKITKEMTFQEILDKNPDAVMILLEKGMHCIGCGMAGFETLEQGAMVHGLNPDELVEEINNSLDKTKKKKKKSKSIKKNKIKKTKKNK